MRQAGGDPLDALRALDRLEVGPPSVEPRRVRVPYAVTAGGRREATELAYRYEEDVFEPGEPASENLAALIGAQVALNYGLFCGEIVLRGPFEAADRRFLRAMAENTAREIYVKKFLEPNPFLVEEAARLPAVRRERYSRAELRFPDAPGGEREGRGGRDARAAAAWPADRSRHAVLASGGKDSLLSHGLLAEMGRETHSVFVNESGRHWYTALNAYRHLARTRPERTARVWTTSDRVFAWMLRRLPFVREDWGDIRSDQYPIRLWTVAVFLFGALPVLRRRRIGRLVIGDEFDTTRRASHRGIPHYDGLYDQSRWFDEALTRYYARKRWPLVQFSVLRPLSELLIQRTLAERYPELRRRQVSCHAASLENGHVRPCGRCEKCRRIVGLLVAGGADPVPSGYSPDQVRACLGALAEKGVHQEAPAAEHLGWMLARAGILPRGAPGFPRIRRHPEVMRLRFHPEAAPPDGIPCDLREPVYRRLLEHAEGAVLRRERGWAPFDPLSPEALARPYRYEPDRGGSVRGNDRTGEGRRCETGGDTTRRRGGAVLVLLAAALLGAPPAARAQVPVEHMTSELTTSLDLPFSEAVRVGHLLFLSGQIGNLPGKMELVPGGIAAETRQTLENIRRVLELNESSLDRVVKCSVMLADASEWGAMNEVYLEFFPRDRLPARSAFGTGGLALGARVEIECIATVGDD